MQRRETERQAEARLSSHAYLRQLDEEEPWRMLVPVGADSPAAQAVLDRICAATAAPAGDTLPRSTYATALLPPRLGATPRPKRASDEAGPSGEAMGAPPAVAASRPRLPNEPAFGHAVSRAMLDAAPSLEARMGLLFAEPAKVQLVSHAELLRLVPTGTSFAALRDALSPHAALLHGSWVARAGGLPESDAGEMPATDSAAHARDALLLLFARSPSPQLPAAALVSLSATLGCSLADLEALLPPLAYPTAHQPGAWTLREPRDEKLLGGRPEVGAAAERGWATLARRLDASRKAAGLALLQTVLAPLVVSARAGAPPAFVQPALAGAPPPFVSAASPRVGSLAVALAAHAGSRSLLSIGACRDFLRASPAAAGARGGASLSDEELLGALPGSGWRVLDGRFVQAATGDASADPVRGVVLRLLAAKAGSAEGTVVRKAEVMAAFREENHAEAPTAAYTRALQALCDHSGGGVWRLRAGED